MMPDRVISQVMDIGDHDDVQALVKQVGNDSLRAVIAHAQAGQFFGRRCSPQRNWGMYFTAAPGLLQRRRPPYTALTALAWADGTLCFYVRYL